MKSPRFNIEWKDLVRRHCEFRCLRRNIALCGGHGFVAEQFHQRVDADVGVGEFRGVRLTESVHERAADGLRVGACTFEAPLDAGLQGSGRDRVRFDHHGGERSAPEVLYLPVSVTRETERATMRLAKFSIR
jgi:hypothetical protein